MTHRSRTSPTPLSQPPLRLPAALPGRRSPARLLTPFSEPTGAGKIEYFKRDGRAVGAAGGLARGEQRPADLASPRTEPGPVCAHISHEPSVCPWDFPQRCEQRSPGNDPPDTVIPAPVPGDVRPIGDQSCCSELMASLERRNGVGDMRQSAGESRNAETQAQSSSSVGVAVQTHRVFTVCAVMRQYKRTRFTYTHRCCCRGVRRVVPRWWGGRGLLIIIGRDAVPPARQRSRGAGPAWIRSERARKPAPEMVCSWRQIQRSLHRRGNDGSACERLRAASDADEPEVREAVYRRP
ncbi:hypothetical protein SKAU_G00372990 [Synaphobranchus kaupii]|uniref:Uncharacterized protein n=1 Tax=Synaphobranchus kaupii TaxID=118154 RepID=A0A9Q1EGE9_SYNKA|nr:hypothetical protein SKAU_G00372990 [Synaphobranchus kaupii]